MTLIAIASVVQCSAAQTNPKREMRALWITPLAYDWPQRYSGRDITTLKNEATTILNNMQASGLNAAFVHMRINADRLYTRTSFKDANGNTVATYDPTSSLLTTNKARGGTLATDANGKDMLDFWVEEGHKRGIEVYAWLNPYRTPATSAMISGKDLTDCVIGYGTQYRYDPGNAKTQTRIVNTCRVLTHNYDIDGIIFDDYFYQEYLPLTSDAPDYDTYLNSGTTLSIADWRRENTAKTCRDCHNAIHAEKPWVRFAVGPAGGTFKGVKLSDGIPSADGYTDPISGLTCRPPEGNYDKLFFDPIACLRDKTIDFLSPQLYWNDDHSTNPYSAMNAWYAMAAEHFKVPIFTSVAIYTGAPSNFTDNWTGYTRVRNQVDHTRKANKDNKLGTVYYSSQYMVGPTYTGLGSHLKEYRYQQPAAIPVINGENAPDPGKPSGLRISGSTLSWNALSGMRYIAYAVPSNICEADAMDPDHGGFKAEYMLANMLYTTSVSISGKTSGYWYAVAPLDRYGNEWPYATLGDVPPSYDAEVALLTPGDGDTAQWSQGFTWTGTEGATFKFELADNANFANIVKTQNSTATSATVDFTALQPKHTYYWRVTVSKAGYRTFTSAARRITAPAYSNQAKINLLSPANGATAQWSQGFSWSGESGATFTFELSADASFSNILRTADGSSTTVNFEGLAAPATYYWRVKATKPLYNDAVSEVRSIATPKLDELQAVKLLSPDNEATLEYGVANFVWSDIVNDPADKADSYVLQISRRADFSSISLTKTAYAESAEVSLSELTAGQKYYWRVRSVKKRHADAFSEVRTFNLPQRLKVRPPRLYEPVNGETEISDFPFTAENVDADKYLLEVALDENFSKIYYSGSEGWKKVDAQNEVDGQMVTNTAMQYYVPLNLFAPGTYYWRVKVSKTGLDDNCSAVETFKVGDGVADTDYIPYRDPASYNSVMVNSSEIVFTNLWLRDDSHNPLPYAEGNVRDMTARGDVDGDQGGIDIVYIADKALNCLHRLDGTTGRQLTDLPLNYDGSYINDLTPNGVLVDDNNDLFVHRIAVNNNTLTIGRVDVATGKVTTVFSQGVDRRIDHIDIYGSVAGGNYTVFGIGGDGNGTDRRTYVSRWIVSNGKASARAMMNVGNHELCGRIHAIDSQRFYVDGKNNVPHLFTFKDVSSASQGHDQAVSSFYSGLASGGCGICKFRHDGASYMVMANSDCEAGSNSKWLLAKSDNFESGFGGMQKVMEFPQAGMTSVEHSSFDNAMPVAVVQRDSRSQLTRAGNPQNTTIYMYLSGNSAAAYTMGQRVVTGVDGIDGDQGYAPSYTGTQLSFGCEVDTYALYDMSGRLVTSGGKTASVELSLPAGIYILRAGVAGKLHTARLSAR